MAAQVKRRLPIPDRRSQTAVLRFALLFTLLLLGLFFVTMARPHWGLEEAYTYKVVWLSSQLLDLLGVSARAEGRVVSAGGFAVRVLNGCNGLEAICIYLAAVLAYPTTLRAKLWAVAIGFPLIQAVNLLRIVGLILVGRYLPTLFQEAHIFVAQALIIFMVGALWLVWIERYAPSRPS
jgi:exosortase H (IPTLxxWG-CTERM-specific)